MKIPPLKSLDLVDALSLFLPLGLTDTELSKRLKLSRRTLQESRSNRILYYNQLDGKSYIGNQILKYY